MNYLYLRAFYVVASEHSFTRAAQVLNVSQSTLSSHVKALEEIYGIRLLERRNRTVVPTDMGGALLSKCRELFRHEEEIDSLLNRGQKLQAGRLKVGADGPKHVLPVLAKFKLLHPDFKISLYSGNARSVAQNLLDYETDVALVATLEQPHAQLYAEPLMNYALVAFVPRTHRFARKRIIEVADLANERLIMREPASLTRHLLNKSLERAGVVARDTMEMDSREAIREAVASGMGISLMSEIEFPSHDNRTIALRINDPELRLTEYVACRKNRKDTRAIMEFFRLAREFCKL